MYKGRDDSIYNFRVTSPDEFAFMLATVLDAYGIEVTDDDIMQLHHFWLDLINLW